MNAPPLTREEAQQTLRELGDGLARLQGFFDEVPEPVAELPPTEPGDRGEPLRALEEAAAAAEARADAAEGRVREADRAVSELEANRDATRAVIDKEAAELATLRAEATAARGVIAAAEGHAAAEAALAEQRAEVAAQAAEVARWRAAGEGAAHLLGKLWPPWLLAGALAGWKEGIEAAATRADATAAAAGLFAALHAYTAATRDADPKGIHDALREVSRRLFPWLREQGLTDGAAVETAGQWAAEINRECAGRAEVEIPTPGAPATNQWMIFRPRPGVNSPDVASVQTWCVRNAQRQPVHRAEVSV